MADLTKVELKSEETGSEVPDTAPAGEDVTPEPTQEPERPQWLPEKFNSAEELAKAYGALETKLGELTPVKAVDDTGAVDMDALTAEMRDTGKLSDATYDQMEKKGIGREVMDRYVSGQEALAREVTRELAEIAGGDEGLKTVMAWAETGLNEQDKMAYNNAIGNADLPGARLALRGVVAAYVDANGREPSLVTAVESIRGHPGAAPFRSRAQMTAAIQDPKYEKDSAYREDVMARIRVSEF